MADVDPTTLPLILAGPIVRRVTTTKVAVWVALRSPASVKLTVTKSGASSGVSSTAFQATQVGAKLYLAMPDLDLSGGTPLAEDQVYFYNLSFTGTGVGGDLTTAGNLTKPNQAYTPDLLSYTTVGPQAGLPSFVLPQSVLSNVSIAQGSCRKAHAESIDAFVTLDATLQTNATTPALRPQQLFLTGDQIYGDDVADATLARIAQLITPLIGETQFTPKWPITDPQIAVGNRDFFVRATCNFTTDENVAKSHLLTFGEYSLMYLLMWSPALWDTSQFPKFNDIYPTKAEKFLIFDTSDARRFNHEIESLTAFVATLPLARRALANVATYMILDDHDATDDFFMNRSWLTGDGTSGGVLRSPEGLTAVRNALLAYALYQAWGNDPPSFTSLLSPVAQWTAVNLPADDTTNLPTISSLVGVPTSLGPNDLEYQRASGALSWSYQLTFANYQVLVFDTRTHRAYPTSSVTGRTNAVELLPAALISNASLQTQMPAKAPTWASSDGGVTFVVTPGPLANITLLEDAQISASGTQSVFEKDVELLHFDNQGFDSFMARLAARDPAGSRVISLCGDIHMSYAARYDYWSPAANPIPVDSSPTGSAGPTTATLAQFVSSAIKNQNSPSFPHFATGTLPMQYLGFVHSRKDITRLGWLAKSATDRLDVGTGDARGTTATWSVPIDPRTSYNAAVTELNKESATFNTVTPTVANDWRIRRQLVAGSTNGQKNANQVSPVNDDGGNIFLALLAIIGSWLGYVGGAWGGRGIVGVNNVAVVSLIWSASTKTVTQTLSWFGVGLGTLYQEAEQTTPTALLGELSLTTATIDLTLDPAPDPLGTITLPTS